MPWWHSHGNNFACRALPCRQGGTKNLPMHIGQVLKALRIQKGLTQEQLSLDVDMATSNVSRIERGLRQPTTDLLRRLAGALGTSVSEIYAAVEGRAGSALGERIAAYEPETQALLRGYRELSNDNQMLVQEYVKMLRRLQKRERS